MKDEKKKKTLGFGVNDAPLWLVKWFTQRAEAQFNDCYWACLADMKTKVEAYEMIAESGRCSADEYEVDEENTVTTFTGPIRKKGETDDK